MKFNKKIFLTLVFLGSILAISNAINSNYLNNDVNKSENINEGINLKSSDNWNNFTFIHITGMNWTTAKSLGWVIGNGLSNDPYILENMTINAAGSPTRCGILITDSNYYFIIRNCTVSNGGIDANDANIKLMNTKNGILFNNTCVDGNGHGISFINCKFNNITENNIEKNNEAGIILVDRSNYNNISGNIVNDNGFGIILTKCKHNNITDNRLNKNGIMVENSNFTLVLENDIKNSEHFGISLVARNLSVGDEVVFCINNTVSGNTITNSEHSGISLDLDLNETCIAYVCNNTISDNLITNNNVAGVSCSASAEDNSVAFINNNVFIRNNITRNTGLGISLRAIGNNSAKAFCNYNKISKNNISYNSVGIISESDEENNAVAYCNFSIISNNIISDNLQAGIFLLECGNITLFKNNMTHCGVLLIAESFEKVASYSIDTSNKVNEKSLYYYVNKKNLVSKNFTEAGQIILLNCNDSVISDLDLSYATCGVLIGFSHNNTISNVTSSNGMLGLALYNSTFHNITEYTANGNIFAGLYVISSNNNSISQCTANYNYEAGIGLYKSNYNNITDNTANNNKYGIYLEKSSYNLISGNTLLNNQYCIYESGKCIRNIKVNNNCGLPSDNGDDDDDEKEKEIFPIYYLYIAIASFFILIVIIIIVIKKRK